MMRQRNSPFGAATGPVGVSAIGRALFYQEEFEVGAGIAPASLVGVGGMQNHLPPWVDYAHGGAGSFIWQDAAVQRGCVFAASPVVADSFAWAGSVVDITGSLPPETDTWRGVLYSRVGIQGGNGAWDGTFLSAGLLYSAVLLAPTNIVAVDGPFIAAGLQWWAPGKGQPWAGVFSDHATVVVQSAGGSEGGMLSCYIRVIVDHDGVTNETQYIVEASTDGLGWLPVLSKVLTGNPNFIGYGASGFNDPLSVVSAAVGWCDYLRFERVPLDVDFTRYLVLTTGGGRNWP